MMRGRAEERGAPMARPNKQKVAVACKGEFTKRTVGKETAQRRRPHPITLLLPNLSLAKPKRGLEITKERAASPNIVPISPCPSPRWEER